MIGDPNRGPLMAALQRYLAGQGSPPQSGGPMSMEEFLSNQAPAAAPPDAPQAPTVGPPPAGDQASLTTDQFINPQMQRRR